ncbi:MAG: amino acid ABC transporter substrate-binding protein [Gammaproteobacteria bacterium]|nr:amino acid ABC transporter substrate-binding protein [Gammaproteobacteria bacterium]
MIKLILKVLTSISLCVFTVTSHANPIRFGVIDFYPPFVFSSKSQPTYGFDIEVAKALCQQLKTECTFTSMPLNQLFSSLAANQIDAIMGAISLTPERKLAYAFTRPYLRSTMDYVTLTNTNLNVDNLQGKRVGVVKDSTFYNYLRNKYEGAIQLVTYGTNQEVVTALSNNEVDIILLDSPAANYWIKYSAGVLKSVGTPTFLPFDEGYAILLKKDNTALTGALNQALNTIIQNGTFAKIKSSYFSN